MADLLNKYLTDFSSEQDPVLGWLQKQTNLRTNHARMLCGPVEGKLMEFISRRDAIISVLADASDPISIVLGEGKENEKANTSLIIAKHSGGKIGVIGPKRMSYENVIPSIAYFAQKLGDIINKAINDME